jgi:hypothetical protein
MSKYTTQLRHIVESGINIFDFEYPIFDSKYKPVLEQKIINHYYFREIGLETVEQFKHFLKTKMTVIMPYYNEQYQAFEQFKSYDPYVNKDLETKETRSTSQESQGSATGSGNDDRKDVFSDTPQGELIHDNYATNITETSANNKGSSESQSSFSSTDEYVQTVKGFDGMKYASDVYKDIKEVISNIDQQIINELNDLFMNIY